MNIEYRKFKNSDSDSAAELIQALYREDPSDRPIILPQIKKTFERLCRHPELGCIMIIECGGEIAGYSILINFWSNEFGGNVCFIDELYVKKEFRGKGIAGGFIKYLAEVKFADSVALRLEVTPANKSARKLYEKLGFKPHKNDTLDLEF